MCLNFHDGVCNVRGRKNHLLFSTNMTSIIVVMGEIVALDTDGIVTYLLSSG